MYESSLFSFFRSERVRPCCLPLVKLVCPSNAKGNIIMSPSIHRCTKQGGLRLTIYHWKTNSNIKSIIKSKQVVIVQFYISFTLELSTFDSPFQACPSLKHSEALSYVCESTSWYRDAFINWMDLLPFK
jgi:hypothetical protein